MMWEVERHNWSELEAEMGAGLVPQVIERLLNCATEEEAWEAAELLDNNVVVQGWLFDSAPSTAACLVIALPFCAPHCRLTILELLFHLCGGPLAPEGSGRRHRPVARRLMCCPGEWRAECEPTGRSESARYAYDDGDRATPLVHYNCVTLGCAKRLYSWRSGVGARPRWEAREPARGCPRGRAAGSCPLSLRCV
jgi:hypothetical protein